MNRIADTAVSTVSDVPEVFEETSQQDKLTLMAVHAERRKSHPPGNIFGMYLGVAVCTILVLVGWVITLPKSLGSSSNQKDGAIAAVKEYGSAFTKSFANDKPFEASAQLIENMKKQAESAKNE
ncbi:MAG: hypothetical protein AAB668_02470 [Patescibacteria group bacterium]